MNPFLFTCSCLLLLVAACKHTTPTVNTPSANADTTLSIPAGNEITTLGAGNISSVLLDSLVFDKKYGDCAGENPCVSVNTQTMQVKSGISADAQQQINAALRIAVAGFLAVGEEQAIDKPVAELAALIHTDFEKNGKEFGMSWDYQIKSHAMMNQLGILSVETAGITYTGGAHPNHANSLQSFNLATGKLVTLDDILIPTYKPRLTQVIAQDLRKAYEIPSSTPLTNHGFVENTILPNDNFMLMPEKLVFHYNPYEIAPYAMGHIVVEIPYSEIADLIKPNSIVSPLLH